MGDFNAKLGEEPTSKYIGKYGLWKINEAGMNTSYVNPPCVLGSVRVSQRLDLVDEEVRSNHYSNQLQALFYQQLRLKQLA